MAFTKVARMVCSCDRCKTEIEVTSAIRPAMWVRLKVEADAADFQGNPCADAGFERMFCNSCGVTVLKALGDALNA